MEKRPETCQECEACTYIGGGDYVCANNHGIVITDFGQPTEHWMECQRKGEER